MTVEELKVVVSASTEKFHKAMDKVQDALQESTESANKSSIAFGLLDKSTVSLIATVTGVTAALAGVAKEINECIKLTDIQQEAELKLAMAMKRVIGASDDAINSVKEYAGQLQKLGVVGDEVALAGASQLAYYVKSEKSIKKLLGVMEDLAVAENGVNVSSQDMKSIGDALGMALQGNTSYLRRLKISLTDAQESILKFGTEEQKVDLMTQILNDRVGGMSQAMAGTYAGQVAQLSNAWGDLKESVGALAQSILQYIIPVLKWVVQLIQEITDGFTWLFKEFGLMSSKTSPNSIAGSMVGTGNTLNTLTNKATGFSNALGSANKNAKSIAATLKGLVGIDELNTLSKVNGENSGGINSLLGGSLGTSPLFSDTSSSSGPSQHSTSTHFNTAKTYSSVGEYVSDIPNLLKSSLKTFFTSMKNSFLEIKNYDQIGNIKEEAKKFVERIKKPMETFTELQQSAQNNSVDTDPWGVPLSELPDTDYIKQENPPTVMDVLKDLFSLGSVDVYGQENNPTVVKIDKKQFSILDTSKVIMEKAKDAVDEFKWNIPRQVKVETVTEMKEKPQSIYPVGIVTSVTIPKSSQDKLNEIKEVVKDKIKQIVVNGTGKLATSFTQTKTSYDSVQDKKVTTTTTAVDDAKPKLTEHKSLIQWLIDKSKITNSLSVVYSEAKSKLTEYKTLIKYLVDKNKITNNLSVVSAEAKSKVDAFKKQWDNLSKNKTLSMNITASVAKSSWNSVVTSLNNNAVMKKLGLKLPYLAKGGVVDGATLAMIGEAGKEAVLPLENNTQWMDTFANMLGNKIGGYNNDALNITLNVGGVKFGTACINSINQAQRQAGTILLNI